MKRASTESTKPTATGERFVDALRVDGNAAAGILSEVFVQDLTGARARCRGCGTTRNVGALLVYAHGMGTVVRCPGCDNVMLRIAGTPTHVWLDASGAASITITRRID